MSTPQSTLGVQLIVARCAINRANEACATLGDPDWDFARLDHHLRIARVAIDRAIEHYDHDKLSDIGATCE